jgi:hypothetical protein
MMSEFDHVKQQIAALQQEQHRLHQLTFEAQASLTQLSKEQTTSQQWASLEWVKQREQQYRDTQSQLLAALERRFELELSQAPLTIESHSPHLGQTTLSFLALTCTSMLSSAPVHWLKISNSGRSRGTMIPWFGSLSLALCPSMLCFSGIACPWFDLDLGFYSIERRTGFLLSSPPFCLTLPLLSPGRIESRRFLSQKSFVSLKLLVLLRMLSVRHVAR